MTDRLQALRLGILGLIAAVQMFGYALARPATESLFLEDWGSARLPWAWGAVAVGALAATAAWERAAARMELARLLAASALASALLLAALLLAHGAGLRGASFLLYVWKDVYIVVLVEGFYAFANVVFPFATARKAYGAFGLLASVGGMLGNFSVGRFALAMGTERTPWLVAVDLVLVALLAGGLATVAPARRGVLSAERPGLVQGLRLVAGSRALRGMLAMVATVQVLTNLVDFAWSRTLERELPELDARTAVIGQVYGAIDALSIGLNLATPLLLRGLGVPLTLLGVPLVMGLALAAAAFTPGFLAMAVAKISNKALDYTVQRAAKEALYLPLSYVDKTQGKALVDMLTYRVAKGGASALVLGLVAAGAQALAMPLALGLVGAWALLARALGQDHRTRTDAPPSL